ncbi:MAG: ATP-binding protein [Carboxylicivirga sp.]|jgi:signal transduction histidine kinase|nr:ATP-binding protein [Carboxylicivirga sp.]
MSAPNLKAKSNGFNAISLSFSPKMEKAFRLEYFENSIVPVRVALLLVMALYAAFGILDYQIYPDHADRFIKIRFLLVIPFACIVLLLSYTPLFKKIWQILLLSSLLIGSTGIIVMTMHEPDNYTYYAGVILVLFAGYMFFRLNFYTATIGGWAVVGIFNIIALLSPNVSSKVILSSNFFFVGANLIGMFAAYYIETNIRKNFYLNKKIDEEKQLIKSLNTELENKVKKRTEQLLLAKQVAEQSSANVKSIIEGTTENIWAFNKNYELMYLNDSFKQAYLNTFGAWLEPGDNLIEALPHDLRDKWQARYNRVLNNEQFEEVDVIETTKGKLYIRVGFNPIVREGNVIGGSCFGKNITYQKMAELEVLKAKEQAEKSDKLKSAFLTNMSHEIRTPMNGILGFAELLKEPELSGDDQLTYIDLIEKSGLRLLNIINDIVDISKIEAGLVEVTIQDVNLDEMIRNIYRFFQPETHKKGIDLVMENSYNPEDTIIQTDKEKLYTILTNLLKNAIKYTDEGYIKLSYTLKESAVEFTVQDTGIGIPAERLTDIFERFMQVELTNKLAEQGAGLGLSITKEFIEMLGGHIWVSSKKSKGSSFYFMIPYNKSHHIRNPKSRIKSNMQK